MGSWAQEVNNTAANMIDLRIKKLILPKLLKYHSPCIGNQFMRYFLFIDESGDHGLHLINPDFPVFLLGGVLVSETEYGMIDSMVKKIKTKYWKDKKVIFHSRDIRKCEKEFQILFDSTLKSEFYNDLNTVIARNDYTIIASGINKQSYINKFGRLSGDVYELALSFIIERAVFFLDDIATPNKELFVVIERRGKNEDKKLEEHFQRLLSRGTGYVSSNRLVEYNFKIKFRRKNEDVNGLQLADLIAYPLARYVIDPNRANPAFDVFASKIYSKSGKRYGLKVFP